MEENKITNNEGEVKIPAPPPVVPKKEVPKKKNKKALILIPVIIAIAVAAVLVAVLLKNTDRKEKPEPIIVTDTNGEVVTDAQGEPVTVIPQTEIHEYTDNEGNTHTTVVYKEETVYVPVTDAKGEAVTDKNGESVTEKIEFVPTTLRPGVVGTSSVLVTDGQGNTGVDNQGNVVTSMVELTTNAAVANPAVIDWKDSKGGTAADYYSSVATLKDGGYITAIVTNSTDGNFVENKALKYWPPYTVLIKYNEDGSVAKQEVLGSTKGMLAITSLVATPDGGFYAVGYGKDVGEKTGKGYYDGVVYKFNEECKEVWCKTFGTSTVDLFNGATLTHDGGIIAVGSVGNNDGDAKGFGKPELKTAACIVKYNSNGELVFKNIVGGDKDTFSGVAVGTEGDIFCVGNFYSGELFKNMGYSDGGVAKFSADGKYIDIAPIAGTGIEGFNAITSCKNGGVAVVGRSNSSDAGSTDSMFVSDLASRGGYDAYIMKFDEDLFLRFATAFRGQNNDNLTAIVEKDNGDFIVAGYSNSSTRDLKGITTRGGDDMVIASFDKYGDLSWARSFGGTKDDSANAICIGNDGGYIVAGRTLSKDIDMKGIAQYINGKSVGVIVKFPE